jgi:hypothetical protein
VCSLLIKKYQKSKSKEKNFGQKKIKEKNSKREEKR